MPKVLSDVTTRRRDVSIKVEWPELKELLSLAAINASGIESALGVNGVKVEVRIEQKKEGSPSYSVDEWSAIVTVAQPVD